MILSKDAEKHLKKNLTPIHGKTVQQTGNRRNFFSLVKSDTIVILNDNGEILDVFPLKWGRSKGCLLLSVVANVLQ